MHDSMRDNNTCQHGSIESDDETCVTDNRLLESVESKKSRSEKSSVIAQIQVILALQESLKMIKARQQNFLDYIDKLEESLAILSIAGKDLVECKQALKCRIIFRKRERQQMIKKK